MDNIYISGTGLWIPPHGITNDGINIYVAGYSKHTIRKIEILSGDVTTIAGSAHES